MKNRWKKLLVIMGSAFTMITVMACGNSEANESIAEVSEQEAETTSGITEEQENIAESSVNDETDNMENGEAETDEVSKDEEADVEKNGKYMIGDAELEAIIEPYDKVLSRTISIDGVSFLQSYFGYNVPEGWEWPSYHNWEDPDGRKESRMHDGWINTNNSAETIDLDSFYGDTINYWYDQDGNKVEVLPGSYRHYQNCYHEALHTFMETGKWEEPEREKQLEYEFMRYYTNMTMEGEIQTPYGKGILYRGIYEGVPYTGYDEETGVYTEIDTDSPMHSWHLEEGMLIEVDDLFIRITYHLSDWYSSTEELPDSLANREYTGRLESIIPLMFEVK